MELKEIKGIGAKTIEHLHMEHIYTPEDLLLTFPKGYQIYEIRNEEAFSGEAVCVEAMVDANPVFLKYRRNIHTIIFNSWINQNKVKCVSFSSDYLRYKLFRGTKVVLYGRYKKENREFLVQNIFFDSFSIKIELDYKLKNISNALMTRAVRNALQSGCQIAETLPLELIEKYRLYSAMQYVYASHFPQNRQDCIQMQRRRKYEEFFWYAVSLELLKTARTREEKLKRSINHAMIENFIQTLPYALSEDQRQAISCIARDIEAKYPMNRLVQGDVGCGKSIVAYISALMLITAGFQAVIMVPTEVLAVQQYENIKRLFRGLNLSIELLTSSVKSKEKDDILYRLMNHRVQVIVGTHALIEDKVSFYKLGIVIIDEQHRFGVNQRSKLIDKFPGVDCLYLTATPIPRTLGLTSFGDLDISSIHTMPNNRLPIETLVFGYERLNEVCRNLDKHIAMQEQAYIVVPLIEKTEDKDSMDIKEAYSYFSMALPNIRIGVVHGKMTSEQKNQMMQDFKNKRYDILLSTTVIEVGVDVPNATVMVIMDANRYGLAQIHQLRGRVGRGTKKSYCYLISWEENERLEILKNTNNGFDIAAEDFKLRGPGDYLGNQQSGYVGLSAADFQADFKIWSCAKTDGEVYCRIFLKRPSTNPKFLRLLAVYKNQKMKIN